MDTWSRIAETWVYDYEEHITVRTLADLAEGQEIQPPTAGGEKQKARTLALVAERALSTDIEPFVTNPALKVACSPGMTQDELPGTVLHPALPDRASLMGILPRCALAG